MTPKPTKAKTKGARKRNRQKITMANGDTATAPRGPGRPTTEDARKTALQARIRVHGIAPADATDPLTSTAVDRCIMALAQDRAAIAQCWQSIVTAQHNYRTRILGQTGYPKGAAIAMLPDAMQTDTGHTIDIRTADERDASAKRAWASWDTRIKALPVPQFIWAIRAALSGGMDGAGGDVWRDGQATPRGIVLVQALTLIARTG